MHIISGPNKEVRVHNRTLQKISCVSKQVVEILEDTEKLILRKTNYNNNKPVSGLPIRSQREEYVHNAVRQALFNTEVLIHDHLNDRTWTGQAHRVFIPVIVTNARLLSATYTKADINDQARLIKFINIEPVPFSAINHTEILRSGSNFEDQIDHVGIPPSGPLNMSDERFKGTHNKTVFVVNKSHILDFIDMICLNFK